MSKSLFLFGSLGGNDYNAMLFFGFTVDQARNYTPKIVDTIITGVEAINQPTNESSRKCCSLSWSI
mgnify:CR=1 FL=1